MSVECFFCHGPVNPHDISTWKRVAGWVGGERKDSMTMREDTGEYAHTHCVEKARSGQEADQPTLDEAMYPPIRTTPEALPGWHPGHKPEGGTYEVIDPAFTELMADDDSPPPAPTKSLGEMLGHPGGHYG